MNRPQRAQWLSSGSTCAPTCLRLNRYFVSLASFPLHSLNKERRYRLGMSELAHSQRQGVCSVWGPVRLIRYQHICGLKTVLFCLKKSTVLHKVRRIAMVTLAEYVICFRAGYVSAIRSRYVLSEKQHRPHFLFPKDY